MKNIVVRTVVILGLLAAGPGLMLGCDKEEHGRTANAAKPEPKVAIAPGAADVGSARDSIVAARCDREERCANIGDGKDYATKDACRSKLEGKTGSDLNAEDCAHGVYQPKLSDCLSKIRAEDCGNPIDSLARFAACRTGEICI